MTLRLYNFQKLCHFGTNTSQNYEFDTDQNNHVSHFTKLKALATSHPHHK